MNNNTLRRAKSILGYGITSGVGNRTFPVIDGIAYTDVFTSLNGDYKTSFNGDKNTTYKNQVEADGEEITLSGTWGSAELIAELEPLLTWLQNNTLESSLDNAGVKRKDIEDFSITLGTAQEVNSDRRAVLLDEFSFYIRNPLIIGVSKEHYNNDFYF